VKTPLLLGHRGVRPTGFLRLKNDLPRENSIPAFEYALTRGCDGLEFDVHHTLDGRNVLWHDPEYCGREIAATSFNNLAGSRGIHPACLEDVLRQFGQRAFLDIELKTGGGEESMLAALEADAPQRGFVISSFLPNVLQRLRELRSDLPLGFICDRKEALFHWRELSIQVVLPHNSLVRPELVTVVHRRSMQLITWTVNEPDRMRQLADWGVDGIISDDPKLLYQTFHSR